MGQGNRLGNTRSNSTRRCQTFGNLHDGLIEARLACSYDDDDDDNVCNSDTNKNDKRTKYHIR